MNARFVLLALVIPMFALVACRTEPRPASTPTAAPTASSTPSTTVTPAPTSTPEFVDVVFCEQTKDGASFFERCPSGTPGNGFVATVSQDVLLRFPMGARVLWCVQLDPSAETYRAIVDEPCAYDSLMTDGLRPIPTLTEGIPRCQMDEVLGYDPPPACAFGEPHPHVLAQDAAIKFMTGLRVCGAELGAFADLEGRYEPVIEALHGLDTSSDLAPLRDAAQAVLDYEFDPLVPTSTNGVRELHAEVLAALDPVLGGEVEAAPEALGVIEAAHHFYGLGRGCGG
jgi:hypothetical protein